LLSSINRQSNKNFEVVFFQEHFELAYGNMQFRFATTANTPVPAAAVRLQQMAAAVRTPYILLLTSGQLLAPNCLDRIIGRLSDAPCDLLYFDHDSLGTDGKYQDPYFKPDWSPDAILAHNYIGDSFVISTALLQDVASRLVGEADELAYAALLQATVLPRQIGHLPEVLTHYIAGVRVPQFATVERAMESRWDKAFLEPAPGGYNVLPLRGAKGKVSIIIPTKDNAAMLETSISSIVNITKGIDYEIIVLNNNSVTPEFFQLVESWEKRSGVNFRCITASFPFNFSRLMNLGVSHSNGEFVLLLNNDVEILHQDWLVNMAGYAARPHVGAVGVKLLFPSGAIQHAGIVLGVGEASAHAFINLPEDTTQHFNSAQLTCNYSAVTAACLMVRMDTYIEVAGMDEQLPVEFNDIDFCLRLRAAGYFNVYLPFVKLIHYESATRGHPFRNYKSWKQHEQDLAYFLARWQKVVDNDPFYNPNLSRSFTDMRQAKRIKR
jgi:GT2 family glycosyltransferase